MKDKIIHKGKRAASHIVYKTSDGQIQPGGSTIAKLIQFESNDPLLQWAVNLHKAGQDFRQFREEAADFGNAFHRAVECQHKQIRFDEENYPGAYVAPAKIMCANFFAVLKEQGLVMLESEVFGVSDEERWGGTIDLVLAWEDEPTLAAVLGDLKSSNSIGADHVVQVGGCYRVIFREKYGREPERVVLFRADRNPPHIVSAHTIPSQLLEPALIVARLARKAWDYKQLLTRRI